MFRGKPNKVRGPKALEVLDDYRNRGSDNPPLPRMPAGLVEILGKCFRDDPAERWTTLAEIAEALRAVYREAVGGECPKPAPLAPQKSGQAIVDHDRWTRFGVHWHDPREFLVPALQAAGRDPAQVESLLVRALSRKAQPIADLIGYEEARRILEQAIANGRRDLAATLARLSAAKASKHRYVHDAPGCISLYDEAIVLFEQLVDEQGLQEFGNELARTYSKKGTALQELGNSREAVVLYHRASAKLEQLVEQEERPEISYELARTYHNTAVALASMGDLWAALVLYDRAIAIDKRLVEQEGLDELAKNLAITYQSKAAALVDLGDLRGAVALYDRAIFIHEGLHELDDRLPEAYQNKAAALHQMGDLPGAVDLYDLAIQLYDLLGQQRGRHELASQLAVAVQNMANALAKLGDLRSAVIVYDRAIAIQEQLVKKEGRHELANELARTYQNKAVSLAELGDSWGALALYDRAIEIYERLLQQEGRRELANELARTYQNKGNALVNLDSGNALVNLGNLWGAMALFDQAIAIRERLVREERRYEILGDVAWTRVLRAKAWLDLGETEYARTDAHEGVAGLRTELARTHRTDLQGALDWALDALRNVL